jgi:hypothetical protein
MIRRLALREAYEPCLQFFCADICAGGFTEFVGDFADSLIYSASCKIYCKQLPQGETMIAALLAELMSPHQCRARKIERRVGFVFGSALTQAR